MADKRQLKFNDLDEAFEEAATLSLAGYQSIGHWNLSQCCGHLNCWLEHPMDGYPNSGAIIGLALWLMKNVYGRRQLQRVLASGFKNGSPTLPITVPQRDFASESQALANLRGTINRFNSHAGPFYPSPLFGEMDKQTLQLLQLKHFEHHRGFLLSGA